MSRLRWLTAGESHGPALVATLEGLPAGVPITTDMVADHLARRRLGLWARCPDEVRARRGHLPRRRPARPDPRLPGRGHGGQHRVAEVGAGHGGRPGRPGDPRRARPQRPADPARGPATPTSRACRSTASTRPGRSWSAPRARETAARVALGAVARSYLKETAGIEIVSPRRGAGAPRRRRTASTRRRPTSRSWTRTRCAAWTRTRRRRWSPRSTRPTRTATPSAVSSRSWRTACRWASVRTCTGTAGWTPGSPPPSWASRRSRASRSATASTWRGCPAPRRTTRSWPPTRASGVPPAAPAAPRAG